MPCLCCRRACCCVSPSSHHDEERDDDTLAILDARNTYGALDSMVSASCVALGFSAASSGSSGSLNMPLRQCMPWRMNEGKMIMIDVQIPTDAYRWSVNLMGGGSDSVAFHCSIRHDRKHLVRNSMQYGVWGEEEIQCPGGMPFVAGEAFRIHILCIKGSYLMSVNGVVAVRYRHRVSPLSVGVLAVSGSVQVLKISYSEEVADFPPPDSSTSSSSARVMSPVSSPTRCYSVSEKIRFPHALPSTLETHGEVVLLGRVKLLPYSFYINLQTSCLVYPEPDLLLHFNPRFQWGRDRHLLVLNSRSCGYGQEVRISEFPFSASQCFCIRLVCETNGWKIMVNDEVLTTFEHRLTSRLLRAVDVAGDVLVTELQFYPRGRDLIDL